MARFRTLATALGRSTLGATAVEFALVLPVLLLTTLGTIEMAIVLFIGSSMEAAVIEASRYGITGGETGVSREQQVRNIVEAKTYGLLDMDRVDIDTLVYASFADIGQPEPFTDDNLNGAWDTGEPFTDVNGNGQWDPDMGAAGLGGPSDIVVYRLSYDWGVVTPMIRDILGGDVHHVSSIAVRNEPY
jgi:Flp pilus assembly protein TadG